MDISPLIASSLAIQIHVLSASAAAILGTVVLFLRKGTPLHKGLGRAWIVLMATVALGSFQISEIGMFGPYSIIHILSAWTLFALAMGIWFARRGNIAGHKATMISLYSLALLLTGAFTLLPGRRMRAVIFADGGQTAALTASAVALFIGAALLVRRRVSRSFP